MKFRTRPQRLFAWVISFVVITSVLFIFGIATNNTGFFEAVFMLVALAMLSLVEF